MKKKTLKYLLGIVVTALALWLSFRNLDWNKLRESFVQVNLFWVALAVLSVLVSVYIAGIRWHLLLKSRASIPLTEIFKFNVIGQYVNIVIPARFGELLRAWLAARKYSLSGSYVLGTIVIEKFVETIIVVILAGLAPLFITFQERLRGHTVAVVAVIALIPIVSFVIWKRELVRRWLTKIANIFPASIRQRLLNFLDKGMEAFSQLKSIKMTLRVVLITILVIVSQVITSFILFQAFGFKLYFFEALVLQVVLIIGMSLPSVPGKIGVFEYTVLLVLTMFGIEKGAALSYGLMLHVIAYLPKMLLGFVFMANMNISLKKTGEEMDKFQAQQQEKKQ